MKRNDVNVWIMVGDKPLTLADLDDMNSVLDAALQEFDKAVDSIFSLPIGSNNSFGNVASATSHDSLQGLLIQQQNKESLAQLGKQLASLAQDAIVAIKTVSSLTRIEQQLTMLMRSIMWFVREVIRALQMGSTGTNPAKEAALKERVDLFMLLLKDFDKIREERRLLSDDATGGNRSGDHAIISSGYGGSTESDGGYQFSVTAYAIEQQMSLMKKKYKLGSDKKSFVGVCVIVPYSITAAVAPEDILIKQQLNNYDIIKYDLINQFL